MSDQERDKHIKATEDEGGDDVEAHKHGHREADGAAGDEDSSDDVEAHKLHGKDV